MRGFIERHGGLLRGGRNSGDCGETTDGSTIRVNEHEVKRQPSDRWICCRWVPGRRESKILNGSDLACLTSTSIDSDLL
jgi:hypothetical protein